MASDNSMSSWLNFFVDAGIPAGEAANHALTFTDHRIVKDMLMDITKEYLNEMGITCLGDVIAILKHAKTVHSQTARDRVLKSSTATSSPTPRRSTPASRTIDHYLKSANDPGARPMNEKISKMSAELASRLGPSPSVSPVPKAPSKTTATKIQFVKTQQKEEVPVPKSRRVFPEHEGKYKITMPSGTTARSKKILQKQGNPAASGSVFSRLGSDGESSSVASTSCSVFNRLGGKASIKRPATSTSVDPDDSMDEDIGDTPLEYAGVFKSTPSKKAKRDVNIDLQSLPKFTVNFASGTKTATAKQTVKIVRSSNSSSSIGGSCKMDADTISTAGVLSPFAAATTQKKSIMARLGRPVVTAASSSTTATVKTVGAGARKNTQTAISSRLGPQKMEVSSSQDVKGKGIFSRLGKQL